METKFTQFLRNGGNGTFLIRRAGDRWFGGRTDLASKSEFPNYTALRDGFAAKQRFVGWPTDVIFVRG